MKRSPKKIFRKLEDWYSEGDEDFEHERKNRHEHNVRKSHKGRIRQYLKREANYEYESM